MASSFGARIYDLLDKPWGEARPGVRVKRMAQEQEFYVLAHSADRTIKGRGMCFV